MFGFFKKKVQPKKEEKQKPIENFINIEDFIIYFKNETGIDFFNKKEIVKNKLIIFCRRVEIFSFDDCIYQIKNNLFLKQELIDYLTVNETYFFRETAQIDRMIEKAKRLGYKVEILCAPSSSGEEPYTIAMKLLEQGFETTDFHIVGIDISEQIILKAQKAIYNERSLHRLNQDLIDKYFIKNNDKYILKEIVKDSVSFRRVNIFDQSLNNLRKFDFIFSRNMMIYFDHDTKVKAKNILKKLLKNSKEPIIFGHADMVG